MVRAAEQALASLPDSLAWHQMWDLSHGNLTCRPTCLQSRHEVMAFSRLGLQSLWMLPLTSRRKGPNFGHDFKATFSGIRLYGTCNVVADRPWQVFENELFLLLEQKYRWTFPKSNAA